jgi:hypothetical protein
VRADSTSRLMCGARLGSSNAPSTSGPVCLRRPSHASGKRITARSLDGLAGNTSGTIRPAQTFQQSPSNRDEKEDRVDDPNTGASGDLVAQCVDSRNSRNVSVCRVDDAAAEPKLRIEPCSRCRQTSSMAGQANGTSGSCWTTDEGRTTREAAIQRRSMRARHRFKSWSAERVSRQRGCAARGTGNSSRATQRPGR